VDVEIVDHEVPLPSGWITRDSAPHMRNKVSFSARRCIDGHTTRPVATSKLIMNDNVP
jgi:hypothetical protein